MLSSDIIIGIYISTYEFLGPLKLDMSYSIRRRKSSPAETVSG
jgi:hypothetical protein